MSDQLAIFRANAPEFASSSDDTIQIFLDQATSFLDLTKYPTNKQDLVVVYLAAHMMWAAGRSSEGATVGGQITLEKEGDLMKQYAPNSNPKQQQWLAQSLYGQQLLWLDNTVFITGAMTRMSGEVPNG